MSTTETIDEGDRVYLRDGTVAEYVANTPAGHVVLVPMYHSDDPREEAEQDTRIVNRVYVSPPAAKIAEEVERLQTRGDTLRAEIASLREESANVKADYDRVHKALGEWSGFGILEAFLQDRITHFVKIGYQGPRVLTFEEALKGDDEVERRNVRLLSLFGRSNGDTEWGINRYSDGSGGWENIYPCTSHEDAVAKARELWEEHVSGWRNGKTKVYVLENWFKGLAALGIEIHEDVAKAIHDRSAKRAEDALSKARKDVAEAEANVTEATKVQL